VPHCLLPERKIKEISCGSTHCMAIDNDYSLFGWGDGSQGCLGFIDTKGRANPTLVGSVADKKVLLYF
jgi:alpha-tubulin suppressor-like RCC1 family protein